MKRLTHYIDIIIYLLHKAYWDIAAFFGKIHGIVLMYHHITDEQKDIMASCQHKPSVFESTLKRLQAESYSFVTLDEMMEIIGRHDTRKFAVITFDDIMDDVYTEAYPILKRMNLPFTIFVAPGLIGTEDFITEEHLHILSNDPLCTVGAHTMSHCSLRKCDDPMREMTGSKEWLEAFTGCKVSYLAYPYGWHCDVSRHNMEEAEKAGFRCAFGTIQSPVSEISAKKKFYLPRKVIFR